MSMQQSSAYWAEQLIAERRPPHTPFLLYGILCFCLGLAGYLAGVLLVFPRYLLGLHALLDPVADGLYGTAECRSCSASAWH
jgi:hypothetical protein